MANENKKPTQDELLKAVSEVLDEALVEYEKLTKGEGIDAIEHVDDMKGQAKGVVGEGTGTKPMMAKEGDAPAPIKEEDKDKDDDKDEDDEKLMHMYKNLIAKMEKRGLMQKMEKEAKDKMKKSEAAPIAAPIVEDQTSGLRKSVDDRFESLTKAIKEVADTVKKIASTPQRKGVAGYAPLKKSEGQTSSLKKSDVVAKLVDLKKSNTAGVDTALINRVETGRLNQNDVERIKSLGILGE